MTLKLIPLEPVAHERVQNKKSFNPGNKIKKSEHKDISLKSICLSLIHYINRGSAFTYEQIDELIMSLQHSILKLQKKKQEILKKNIKRKN